MATKVNARDVCVTQRNALPLMWHLLHKSILVVNESVLVCIETAVCGFALA